MSAGSLTGDCPLYHAHNNVYCPGPHGAVGSVLSVNLSVEEVLELSGILSDFYYRKGLIVILHCRYTD